MAGAFRPTHSPTPARPVVYPPGDEPTAAQAVEPRDENFAGGSGADIAHLHGLVCSFCPRADSEPLLELRRYLGDVWSLDRGLYPVGRTDELFLPVDLRRFLKLK